MPTDNLISRYENFQLFQKFVKLFYLRTSHPSLSEGSESAMVSDYHGS